MDGLDGNELQLEALGQLFHCVLAKLKRSRLIMVCFL